MKHLRWLCLFFLLGKCCPLSLAAAENAVRTWTDAKGRAMRAELVGLYSTEVHLRTEADGQLHTVKMMDLSQADRAYVRGLGIQGVVVPSKAQAPNPQAAAAGLHLHVEVEENLAPAHRKRETNDSTGITTISGPPSTAWYAKNYHLYVTAKYSATAGLSVATKGSKNRPRAIEPLPIASFQALQTSVIELKRLFSVGRGMVKKDWDKIQPTLARCRQLAKAAFKGHHWEPFEDVRLVIKHNQAVTSAVRVLVGDEWVPSTETFPANITSDYVNPIGRHLRLGASQLEDLTDSNCLKALETVAGWKEVQDDVELLRSALQRALNPETLWAYQTFLRGFDAQPVIFQLLLNHEFLEERVLQPDEGWRGDASQHWIGKPPK